MGSTLILLAHLLGSTGGGVEELPLALAAGAYESTHILHYS